MHRVEPIEKIPMSLLAVAVSGHADGNRKPIAFHDAAPRLAQTGKSHRLPPAMLPRCSAGKPAIQYDMRDCRNQREHSNSNTYATDVSPSVALDSGIHAGMTAMEP